MVNKRWDKNLKKLTDACTEHNGDISKIMLKEKYGRFDISDWGSGVPISTLRKIENDSYDMCQTCGKNSRQYWFVFTHHCLKHYLLIKVRAIWKQIVSYFERGKY